MADTLLTVEGQLVAECEHVSLLSKTSEGIKVAPAPDSGIEIRQPISYPWCQNSANVKPMPVTLSIKSVPEPVLQALRARAERNHRSLQGELMAIVEAAVQPQATRTPLELLAAVRQLGLETPAESADMVRDDRDSRR
jgi:plasmid stability protein